MNSWRHDLVSEKSQGAVPRAPCAFRGMKIDRSLTIKEMQALWCNSLYRTKLNLMKILNKLND